MHKLIKSFILKSTVSVIALLVFCNIPIDPAEDINALKALVAIENGLAGIFQDEPVTFKITINYPKHTKNITVKFDTDITDTTFKSSRPGSTENETFLVTCVFKTTKKKKITVEIERTDGTIARFFSEEFIVNDRKPIVEFTKVPTEKLSFTNEFDTLLFIAKTNIPDGEITFSSSCTPSLAPENFTVVSKGDTAKVIFYPQEQTNYTVKCYAKVVNSADTANVVITAITKPVMSSISGVTDLRIGTIDTILFVKPADSSASISFSLLNIQNYDTNIVKVISLKKDTLSIMFKPKEAKTYLFSLLVKKDNLSDTITFQKVVTGAPVSVWKEISAIINASEGKQFLYSLSSHLIDPTRSDITFSSSKGTIDNKSVKYSVPWGSVSKDSILITATINGTISQFKLILNVAPADSSAPELNLIAPATNPFKTNDSKVTCKFTAEDSGAGIGSVTITKNGTVIIDTIRTDNLYQCIIDNLVNGVPVEVKMVVTDVSMRKNRDSITVLITRDITMEDKNPPTITVIADPRQSGRVTIDTGTIKVSIEDGSGIADNGVIAKLNGTALTAVTKSGKIYSIPYKLADYGQNTISIIATDNSTAKNSDTHTIKIDYNTKPSSIELTAPANEVIDVDTLPVFTWTGGDDADSDPVSYRVLYGTSATALTSQSTFVNTKTVTLTSKLATNQTYYWKVIAYTSGTFKDTVPSGTYSFTTVNPDRSFPTLTITAPAPYTAGMRVTSATNNITFTASDVNGIDSAYYTVNATGTKTTVTGTGGIYSFSYTLDRRGRDTINISVVDGSEQHNKTSTQVIVTYNSLLPENITVTAPENNKTDVSLLPTFTWTALTDADGDAISYRVKYSTSSSLPSGSSMTSAVTGTTVTIATALSANTPYYYQVIGFTSSPFPDTARSDVRTFTTVPPAPGIMTQPANQTTVAGSAATFTVVASGTGLTYQWQRGTEPISGATSASYSIERTTSSDHNEQFRCVVTNSGGAVTSREAILQITYLITTKNIGNGTGTFTPQNPYVLHGANQIISFTPSEQSIVAKVYSGINRLSVARSCTLTNVTAPDSIRVQFYAVPTLLKSIPSKGKTFTMGKQNAEPGEIPAHQVTFTYGFFIDSTEVTQQDYSSRYNAPWVIHIGEFGLQEGANRPATCFKKLDAIIYCNERSKKEGLDTVYTYSARTGGLQYDHQTELTDLKVHYDRIGYRLPTEAEWEFAYRGGVGTDYYWGMMKSGSWPVDSSTINRYAWATGKSIGPQPVGQKEPNTYKLYDMAGNVEELVNDGEIEIPAADATDPVGPEWSETTDHFGPCRGGSYRFREDVTAWIRGPGFVESWGDQKVGFRCVLQYENMKK